MDLKTFEVMEHSESSTVCVSKRIDKKRCCALPWYCVDQSQLSRDL